MLRLRWKLWCGTSSRRSPRSLRMVRALPWLGPANGARSHGNVPCTHAFCCSLSPHLATDRSLYVGTADGQLRRYDWSSHRTCNDVVLSARRKITQLEVFPEVEKLLALCNGVLSVHDLTTLAPEPMSSALPKSGVAMFCLDHAGQRRLCLVRKKKLLLCEYSQGRLKFSGVVRLFGLFAVRSCASCFPPVSSS